MTNQLRVAVSKLGTSSLNAFHFGIRHNYWLTFPFNWGRQVFRNGHDILRVLDILHLRPLPAGLVSLDHPWVTGLNPKTGKPIWPENVIYRSAPAPGAVDDMTVLIATGRFLAHRVRQSAVLPEIPLGPRRRMPHAINYMHGSSHYNSGLIILNDIQEAFRHITDDRFRAELRRFVTNERREVLFLFRNRQYEPREFAYLSCCMRTLFPWFCNPNGPQARVLWGNSAPYPAVNLITGHWADDVYALKTPGGAEAVVKPPIAEPYFQEREYGCGRSHALWPEKLLCWATALRVKIRGSKGGMFFIDRRKIYADQIQRRRLKGQRDEDRISF